MGDADRFLARHKNARVLVIPHSLADVDALGAAASLAGYFPNGAVCIPDAPNSGARRVAERLGAAYSKFGGLESKQGVDALILVDANSRLLFGPMQAYIAAFPGPIAVIDHHTIHPDAVRAAMVHIDESASSACEIVYGLFCALNYPLSPQVAELLACGIASDTLDLRGASTRTLEVMACLLKRSPLTLAQIFDLTEGEQDANKRIAVLKAVGRAQVSRAGDFIYARSEASSFEGVAAERLVALGADYAFVAQVTRHEVRLSARCRPALVAEVGADVGAIMAEAGALLGGSGGGHPAAAGANGPAVEKAGEALLLSEALARSQVKRSCAKKLGASPGAGSRTAVPRSK